MQWDGMGRDGSMAWDGMRYDHATSSHTAASSVQSEASFKCPSIFHPAIRPSIAPIPQRASSLRNGGGTMVRSEDSHPIPG